MKILKDILKNIKTKKIVGKTDIEIRSICFDSREAKPQCLFVAVKGTKTDGHNYIEQCINAGATAIVCDVLPEILIENITYVLVEDSSFALGIISSNFYDNPSSHIKVIGITGTNGKTTTVNLLHDLFTGLGYKVGLLSTIENKIGNKIIKSTHTTPDSIEINRLLKEMLEQNCSYCFMEVSSHAIVQNRIAGIRFTGGIFSNITHEHLDYHKNFKEYLKAKKRFFDNLPSTAFAISNIDDKNGEIILQNTKASKYYYSLKQIADFKCRIIENRIEGLQININNNDVWVKLVGEFNAYNILAVYGTAILLGEESIEILKILSTLEPVEGRFYHIKNKKNTTAIIDYAHTPDALNNVLETIKSLKRPNSEIITVVGAGGDRDKSKRPIMAKIACNLSNKVILTSDNPRTEEPLNIIEDMKKGVEKKYIKNVLVISDREEAIKTACMLSNEGDVILIAGKGHEKYQEINGKKYPFDDKLILKKYFNN